MFPECSPSVSDGDEQVVKIVNFSVLLYLYSYDVCEDCDYDDGDV
jgi:hypothetical protein